MDKILIIDDEQINLEVLSSIFSSEFEVLTAKNGEEAFPLLVENYDSISVILLDLIMPVMDGFQFLSLYKQKYNDNKIPIVIVSSDDSSSSRILSLEYNIADFIVKPFDAIVIKKRINNLVNLFSYKYNLEKLVEEKTKEIQKKSLQLNKVNNSIIEALSTVVEFRDTDSGGHVQRIKGVTKLLLMQMRHIIPKYLNLTDERIETISQASVLHDIGKICISDTILLKPGKLTEEEFEKMKLHTIKGCEILDQIYDTDGFEVDSDFFNCAYNICRHHHEKFDGNGYPDGLKGNDIPEVAQVVSLADVFEALTSERVYKNAYSVDKAYEMINDGKCGQFNPVLLDVFNKSKDILKKFIEVKH